MKIKKLIIKSLRLIGVGGAMKFTNRIVRKVAAFTHRVQFLLEWGTVPNPEWFDHFIDQYWHWNKTRAAYSWERGVFNLLALRDGAQVLELCCGDGFNAYHFYSARADNITSVDFDLNAIKHARRNFNATNVNYCVADIRIDMPNGKFGNVIWDGAIEHFTEKEITIILSDIKRRLTPDGILSGHTIVEQAHGKQHHEHEYEFKSKDDLLRFLTPVFRNVRVFETIYSNRHNLYFFASDSVIPFDENWPDQVIAHK